jgi:hypothetical protein
VLAREVNTHLQLLEVTRVPDLQPQSRAEHAANATRPKSATRSDLGDLRGYNVERTDHVFRPDGPCCILSRG